jgi:hypothetical protein
LAVHHHLKKAHGELREVMRGMENVKTHQFTLLSTDEESVTMIPIRKNMPMSSATTKALAAVAAVVPCMKEGGNNCFEDENEWKHIKKEHTAADQDRQELVHEARDKELAQATVEGRVYVVSADVNKKSSRRNRRGHLERPYCCGARSAQRWKRYCRMAWWHRSSVRRNNCRTSWSAGWNTVS